MLKEAEFAYLQSYAFYPGSPEAIGHYSQLLASIGRIEDAIRIARAALAIARRQTDGHLALAELIGEHLRPLLPDSP